MDCVICNNDSMALGVMEACKNSGIDCSTLPILGVDATADGCEAIRQKLPSSPHRSVLHSPFIYPPFYFHSLSDRKAILIVLGYIAAVQASHSATEGRSTGVKRTLEASGKQIHYVFEDSANWDTGQAQKLFELFLRTGVPISATLISCLPDIFASTYSA